MTCADTLTDMPEYPHGTVERRRQYPRGAEPCQACKDAAAAYQRQRRAGARESTAAAGAEVAEGEGARLARLWAAERDAEGEGVGLGGMLGDQADALGCGHPGRWTTDHTSVVCEQCRTRGTSAGSATLADALEAARASRAPKRGEVAPRITEAEARRARIQLHAAKQQARKQLAELLADLEAAGDLADAEGNEHLSGTADGLYDLADGYHAEIADADSLELLSELVAELRAVRNGSDYGRLVRYARQCEVETARREQLAEQQAEQQHREAEAEAEADAEAERVRRQLTSSRVAALEMEGQRRAVANAPIAQLAITVFSARQQLARNRKGSWIPS